MTSPLVSVFVTTYNHATYVEEALDSLRSQTSHDFEVIITDDASPDGTADVIEAWLARTGFKAQFIRNASNRGICANRNAALARSSGTFVCSLSGDDAYQPERIERQLACFLKQPERVAVVYSDAHVVDASGQDSGVSFLTPYFKGETPPSGRIFSHVARGKFFCAPAAMLRRGAIESVGGYDESLAYEDFDMWLRLSHRFDFTYLPGQVVRYRWLQTSLSHSQQGQAAMRASETRILRKWIGVGLERELEQALVDQLWAHGKMQLHLRSHALAQEAFQIAAAADGRLHRRVIAQVAQLPGGSEALRALGLVARRLRRLPVADAPRARSSRQRP